MSRSTIDVDDRAADDLRSKERQHGGESSQRSPVGERSPWRAFRDTIENLEGVNDVLRESNEALNTAYSKLQQRFDQLDLERTQLRALTRELEARVAEFDTGTIDLAGPEGQTPRDQTGTSDGEPMASVLMHSELLRRAANARTPTLKGAIRSVLRTYCDFTDWEVGHGWLVDDGEKRVVSSGVLHAPDETLRQTVAELRRDRTFRHGEGVVGQVFSDHRVAFVKLGEQQSDRALESGLAAAGFRRMLVFPVLVDQEVVAVVEFFSRRAGSARGMLVDAAEAFGQQIGSAYARERVGLELRMLAERLSIALDAADLGVVDWDLGSDQMEWSEAIYRLLGYQRGDIEPSADLWMQHVLPEDRERLQGLLDTSSGRRDFSVSHGLMPPGASEPVWVEARGRVLHDDGLGPAHVHMLVRDITAERKHRQLLEETGATKDRMMATLGHELRNPLAVMLNDLERLVSSASDVRSEDMERLYRQVERMRSVLDDLLEANRVERGEVMLRLTEVDAADLCAKVLTTVEVLTGEQHRVDVSIQPSELRLVVDTQRMEQVLVNLLVNAVQQSARGNISLAFRSEARHWIIEVHDTGAGFSEQEAENLFRPFYQRRPGAGGLGLGLNMARDLVQMHSGVVEARSDGPGRGSTFSVVLPIRPGPIEPGGRAGSAENQSLEGLSVMVVDDHKDAARALAQLLELEGCRVETCFDGRSALSTAPAVRPDVFILDIGLPDMQGTELCRRLLELPELRESTYVALTGFGDERTKSQMELENFDHRLLKPVGLSELEQILSAANEA